MTHATDVSHPGFRFRHWLDARRKVRAERRAQRNVYHQTLRELQSCSDRELASLGFSRLSIKDIAFEAAYGEQGKA
jgi:uncharacterized protein YjiS (DUF1127 family)